MIPYHGGPLSGPKDVASRFWKGRHAMVSFAYPSQLPLIAEVCQSFVLDNGAFSAWRSGKALDIPGYKAWVEEWHRHPGFDWCLIPDVIDGTTEDNDRMVHEWTTSNYAKVKSVPVWHFHESPRRLRALAARFEIVALGSSGQWPTPGTDSWRERLREALKFVTDDQGRPWCKLHGLRMLSPKVFPDFPFSSADSTNAAQNGGAIDRTYEPPDAWQQANVIAQRIENCNSSPTAKQVDEYVDLFSLAEAQ